MTSRNAASRLKGPIVLLILACSLCVQCAVFGDGEKVTKPRIHKSHYKKSTVKKRIGVGRFKLRLFERSGTKQVRMKR